MGWVRISDDYYDHPALASLELDAWGLWLWSLAWSNRNLSDGVIPCSVVRRMDPDGKASGALIDAGRWEASDDRIVVHDFLDWQPSAEQVRGKREKERSRWQRRATSEPTPRGVDAEDDATPPASQPQPQEREPKTSAQRASRPMEDFTPSPSLRAWASKEVPGVDIERETRAWIDWCAANGKSYKDHAAAWRNWMRKAEDYGRGTGGRAGNGEKGWHDLLQEMPR